MKKFYLALLVLGSTSALAQTSNRGPKHGGSDRPRITNWICRADATDGSGIFFLGMGRSYGEAYARANESCIRARQTCQINCELQL